MLRTVGFGETAFEQRGEFAAPPEEVLGTQRLRDESYFFVSEGRPDGKGTGFRIPEGRSAVEG